jgi:hypothetical protein
LPNDKFTRLVPSQRRLQRPPDFSGQRLDQFSQVLLRHGLPGALAGALCLLSPEMRTLLADSLTLMLAAPARYAVSALGIFALMLGYAWWLERRLTAAAMGWMIYLLAVSICEEWVFRVAIPHACSASQDLDLRTMVVVSNIAFGAMHYFTLRWKWQWCVLACFGGMALSQSFQQHGDLALIIGLHWIATFVNTPRLPAVAQHR